MNLSSPFDSNLKAFEYTRNTSESPTLEAKLSLPKAPKPRHPRGSEPAASKKHAAKSSVKKRSSMKAGSSAWVQAQKAQKLQGAPRRVKASHSTLLRQCQRWASKLWGRCSVLWKTGEPAKLQHASARRNVKTSTQAQSALKLKVKLKPSASLKLKKKSKST